MGPLQSGVGAPETALRLAGLGWASGAMWACAAAAPTPGFEDTMRSSLLQFFWALAFFVVVVCIGVLWVGLVRRNVFARTAAIRRRESALEGYYRDLFENSHDIIFTLDLEGRFLSMNKAGEEAFGFARTELAQKGLADLAGSDGAPAALEALARLRQSGTQSHVILNLRARDQSRLVLDLHLRLQYRDGVPIHIQAMGWNITARREAEEALSQSERRLRRSLQERERLGRDLHDGIIQSLYAVGLGLQEIRSSIRSDPAAAEARLGASVTDLNRVIREVRSFIGGIDSEPLTAAAFQQSLEALVTSSGRDPAASLGVRVQPEAIDLLGPERLDSALQIAREALSNSLRHAGATRFGVSLEVRNGSVELDISDDGRGFDPQQPAGAGHGLNNMTARARELNAKLELRSGPAGGTRIVVRLPAQPFESLT